MAIGWKGAFSAVTTHLREDLSVDLAASQRVVNRLIRHGVIALNTVSENNSQEHTAKVTVLSAIVEAVKGRVPVITGVSEYDTRLGVFGGRAFGDSFGFQRRFRQPPYRTGQAAPILGKRPSISGVKLLQD